MANNWYVRLTAAGLGTKDGRSWTNAWGAGNVVWASVLAGDTIWCAGGAYTSFFNIPNGKAGTSANPIQIRRVVATDPVVGGVASDWQSIFDSQIVVTGANLELPQTCSWITFDGRTTAGIHFPATPGNNGGSTVHVSGTTVNITGLTFKWIQIFGSRTYAAQTQSDNGFDLAPQAGSVGLSNITISHCRIIGKVEAIRTSIWNGGVIEYCYIADTRTAGPSGDHADIGYIYGNTANLIWRYNIFNNSPVDGILHEFGINNAETYYGNIFYNWQTHHIYFKGPDSYGPIKIFNNTFYCTHNTGPQSGYIGDGGSGAGYAAGSLVQNNLFYNVANAMSGHTGVTSNHNVYCQTSVNGFSVPSETGGVISAQSAANVWVTVPAVVESASDGPAIVGTEVYDFHMKNSTIGSLFANGITLASDGFLNVDMNGVVRVPGAWTAGALQFPVTGGGGGGGGLQQAQAAIARQLSIVATEKILRGSKANLK